MKDCSSLSSVDTSRPRTWSAVGSWRHPACRRAGRAEARPWGHGGMVARNVLSVTPRGARGRMNSSRWLRRAPRGSENPISACRAISSKARTRTREPRHLGGVRPRPRCGRGPAQRRRGRAGLAPEEMRQHLRRTARHGLERASRHGILDLGATLMAAAGGPAFRRRGLRVQAARGRVLRLAAFVAGGSGLFLVTRFLTAGPSGRPWRAHHGAGRGK